jgi:hypothetical protein
MKCDVQYMCAYCFANNWDHTFERLTPNARLEKGLPSAPRAAATSPAAPSPAAPSPAAAAAASSTPAGSAERKRKEARSHAAEDDAAEQRKAERYRHLQAARSAPLARRRAKGGDKTAANANDSDECEYSSEL